MLPSAGESFEKEFRVASDEDLGERVDQRIVGQGVHLLVFGPREIRSEDDRKVGCRHQIGRGIVGNLNGKKDALSTLSRSSYQIQEFDQVLQYVVILRR